jgi:hypothetical protein
MFAFIGMLLQAVLPFTTVARGSNSQIEEPRQVVVRSAAEWQKVWKEHSSEAPPAINFAEVMVVGVFLGSRPTAGYQVDITAVRPPDDSVVVEYAERRPPKGAIVAQVLTSPFQFVTMRRSSGKVEFRKIDP